MSNDSLGDALVHYESGVEVVRLDSALGQVEFERITELLGQYLPASPATVADIGGGPGRYAIWLAQHGFRIHHRDLVPMHVEQLRNRAGEESRITSGVADARSLDLPDGCVDAVLLFGPLYHLHQRRDRLRALAEARRIARPNAPIVVTAISRWSARLHSQLIERFYERYPNTEDVISQVESDGRLPSLEPGGFSAYLHRPEELRDELHDAGLAVEDIVSVEGIAFALHDLDQRLADPIAHDIVLTAARTLQRVPELLGLGPHLLALARNR